MANYQHHVDRVVVFFSGELTFDAAVDLVDTIEMLIGVYFYALVDLLIASPGGVAMALDHYLDATRRWRNAGVRVRTRVTDRADSAGVFMLTLGDERIAEPRARFLFHSFRVVQPGSLTAHQSARVFADLTRLDDQYLARLVDRAMDGADAASVVTAAVEASDLQVLDRLIAGLHPPAKAPPRSPRALARVLERCMRGAIRSKDRATLAEMYRTLWRLELSISPGVAHILRLIDRVGAQVPASARATGAPADGRFERRQLEPFRGAGPERLRAPSGRARASRSVAENDVGS